MYRPFTTKWLYYDKNLVEETKNYYQKWGSSNLAIITSGKGSRNDFSVLVTKYIPDVNCINPLQGFIRFNNEDTSGELIELDKDNITDSFSKKINLSKDDAFAYVYGLLNSKEYKNKYANDLKKDLARIPIVRNKKKFIEVGKELMDLHLNYEQAPLYTDIRIKYNGKPDYKVSKMHFSKKRNTDGKLEKDRSTIIYNDSITISGIPEKTYNYIINGKSAIEWIMDQYRVKIDNSSGIKDDPNDYSDDPKYIFNLLLRIINVSVQTVDLINQLPKFEVDESYYEEKK